jgi:hypothetical protein
MTFVTNSPDEILAAPSWPGCVTQLAPAVLGGPNQAPELGAISKRSILRRASCPESIPGNYHELQSSAGIPRTT